MAKDLDKNVLEELNKKVDVLLKKFSEQKGIIDGYVKRERDWKKNKTLNLKKIKDLEFDLKKIVQRIMAEIERISLRVFGRDITLACPSDEKDALLSAAELLNEELNGISDKENALILAGLNLANKCLNPSGESINIEGLDLLLEKVDKALKT